MLNFNKKVYLSFASTLVIAALTGCGGGGGGGGSNSGREVTPDGGPVSESSDLIEISLGNTAEAISLSTQPFFFVDVLEEFWFSDPLTDQSVDGPAGGVATVSIQNGILEVDYDNFALTEALRVDGIQRQEFLEADFSISTNNEFSPIEGLLVFDGFQIITDDADITFDGELNTSDIQGSEITINITAADNLSGEVLTITDTVISYDSTNSQDAVADLQGSVVSSIAGSITFSTENPLVNPTIDPETTEFTAEGNGVLTIEGEESAVKLVAQNTNFVSLVFDTDNDQQFESSIRQTWANINNDEELDDVESVGTGVPIANPGTSAVLPIADAPYLVSSLYSHDDDSPLLSHQWKLEVSPPGSELSFEPINQPFFIFEPDVLGEYVYSVVVSDGENSSKVGVKFEVENVVIFGFGSNVSGLSPGLEVVETFDGNQYQYDISAASAINPSATFIDLNWNLRTPGFGSTASLPTDPGGEENQFGSDPLFEGTHEIRASGAGLSQSTDISFTSGGVVQDFFTDIELDSALKSVVNADINNDGFEDFAGIATTDRNQALEEVFVYLSQGDGSYALHQQLDAGTEQLTIEDVNGDGRPDLVTLLPINEPQFNSDYEIRFSLQDENGNFGEFSSLSIADSLSSQFSAVVASGSGNLDSDPESEYWVLLEGRREFQPNVPDVEPQLLVWEENGFSASPSVRNLNSFEVLENNNNALDNNADVTTVAVSDVNDDGIDDVVLALTGFGATPVITHVWENTGDGFELLSSMASRLRSVQEVLVFDQNSDSLEDIVLLSNNQINTFNATESGDFDEAPFDENPFSDLRLDLVDVADFDLDGEIDILSSGRFRAGIAHNDEGNYRGISITANSDMPFDAEEISVFDYNLDGFPDIVAPNDSGIRVYLGGLRSFSTSVE